MLDLPKRYYIQRHINHMKIQSFIFIALISFAFCQEIDYTQIVQNFKANMSDQTGLFYHSAYRRLAYISDTYGPRLWGSTALEKVILEVFKMAHDEGFQNVRLQAVKNFTKWVRGTQQLILHNPRPFPTPLKLIGLGGTVSGHITAQAIVVSNYSDLEKRQAEVKGKIVVYNNKWTTYGQTVQYRSSGASRAAQYGAVGALVRSVTPDSIQSVHTGVMHYDSKYPKIPIAAITTEDAEMLERIQRRNQTILLQLKLQNYEVPNTYSNNVVFEIRGSERPEQILLMGGHIDSWDTGSQTGTNDDAGGFLTCFQAMRLILKNNLKPKRTIRFIAWSGEQWGDPKNGAHAYFLAHKQELGNHIVAFQDDLGSTKLLGFGYSGHSQDPEADAGKIVVKNIANQYLTKIGASTITNDGGAVDTGPLFDIGIPTMNNYIDDTPDHRYYFTYHHSAGDSMTMMNPDELDSNVLGVAVMFYILADLNNSIPKPNIKIDKLNQIIGKINISQQ